MKNIAERDARYHAALANSQIMVRCR
jgi:hypothetical protein